LFAYQVRVESRKNEIKKEEQIKLLNNIAESERLIRDKLHELDTIESNISEKNSHRNESGSTIEHLHHNETGRGL
jgi:hypothetical protein